MAERMVGLPAPKFEMEAYMSNGEFGKVFLDDYKGKWLVLFFYPLDFTFVCPTEITALSQAYDQFKALDCEIVGASTDSKFSHKAWVNMPVDQGGLGHIHFPLGQDITHEVSRNYGVLIEEAGVALRGLFIIDPEGVLKYSVVNHNDIGRSVEETLRVLQALQTGGLCPANWKPGQKTL